MDLDELKAEKKLPKLQKKYISEKRAIKVSKHKMIQPNKTNCDWGKDMKLYPLIYFSNFHTQ